MIFHLKKDMLDRPRIIVIVGDTGAGKSMLGCAFATKIFKKYNKLYLNKLKDTYKNINDKINNNLICEKHLIFSNVSYCLNFRKNIYSWHVGFEDLEIPNIKNNYSSLPVGSFVIIDDDVDLKANCRANNVNKYMYAFLKYHRHNDLTLIIIVQDFSSIDKQFRRFVHQVFYLYNLKTSFFGFYHKWSFKIFNSLNKNLIMNNSQNSFETMRTFHFSIFSKLTNRYYSKYALSLFLNNVDKYKYIENKPFEFSKKYVDYFNSNFDL